MKQLRVYFLKVGQGDSIYCEYETDKQTWHLLVDCNLEPGKGIDVPQFLKDSIKTSKDGKRHLEYLIVTHPHDDHIRGIGEIAKDFVIDELWDSGHIPESDEGDAYKDYKKVKEDCEKRGVFKEKKTTYDVETICNGDIEVLVMRPSNYIKDRGKMTDAELTEAIHTECMVLRLKFGEFALLITGDSNLESWKWIAEKSKYSDDDLASTLMHAIHHGSKTAFWEDSADTKKVDPYRNALEKINPGIVVISVGEENEYDLPNPDAVEVYRDQVGKKNLYQTSEATVYCKVSEEGDYSIKNRKDIDEKYLLPEEENDKKDNKEQSNAAKSVSILRSRTRLDDSPAA